MTEIKYYYVKNKWLINSVLRPFHMDCLSTFNMQNPTQRILHSIVKAIENDQAIIVRRGLGVIERYEELYGKEGHNSGMIDREHPIWQFLYSS